MPPIQVAGLQAHRVVGGGHLVTLGYLISLLLTMGGGQSTIVIKRTVTRPRPLDNTHRGLRVVEAEGCAECKLIIDKGVTAATAKITINPEPTAEKGGDPIAGSTSDENNRTIPDPTDKSKTISPNIYIPSNSVTITPSAPFTGSFNTKQINPYGMGQIQWDQMELFWGAPVCVESQAGAGAQADACLVVRSTTSYMILMIPIQKTGDGSKKGCKFFNKITSVLLPLSGLESSTSGYDPAEDEHIADAWKKLGDEDKDALKNKDAINNYIKYASDGHYDTSGKRDKPEPYPSTTIDTGSDWSLSSLVTGNEAYFTWIDTLYIREDDGVALPEVRGPFTYTTNYKKWSPAVAPSNASVGKLSPRIVYFQDPVYILDTDFAALRGSVKARSPGEVVQTITTDRTDAHHVFYHPACCGAKGSNTGKSTSSSVAQTFAKVQSQQALDMWNQPWFQWMIAAVVLTLMFVFLSWILTYINDVPDNIFVMVGRLITGPPRPAPAST